MMPSSFLQILEQDSINYSATWAHRDESHNFQQRYNTELVTEAKRGEVENEIRAHVDELMRQELKSLKLAIDKDKGKKGKKRSGKKKKKGKRGKKKGKKGMKDITPDRTIESLYEELVCEGIIKFTKPFLLKHFIGDYTYVGSLLKLVNVDPYPSMADIRRAVTEFAILPLGSQAVHEKAPLIKSLMLTGPAGSGKKLLVHAICNESGANMFDLTASNIVGKYPGKDGLKLLLHMVFKVGKALQPSVIYIGDCEKMFKKKLPKTDLTDPKRLKKILPKMMKTIKGEDRIMVVGTSRTPFEGEVKPLSSLYNRIVVINRPEYQSRRLMWTEMIKNEGGTITSDFHLSSLVKISDGYTAGAIQQACKAVLIPNRLLDMQINPLKAAEFIPVLSKLDAVFKEEEEAFKTWYAKTPLGKKRVKMLAAEEEDGKKEKKDKKKTPAGKKKKK